MKGQGLYALKKDCRELSTMCHDIQNRVIEKMCVCDKEQCKVLRKYMCCLTTVEALCYYMCTCCCNLDEISEHCKKEILVRCKKLREVCGEVKKSVGKSTSDYLSCDRVLKQCNKCCLMCNKKRNTRKKN